MPDRADLPPFGGHCLPSIHPPSADRVQGLDIKFCIPTPCDWHLHLLCIPFMLPYPIWAPLYIARPKAEHL
jgi:hypothetical protein